MMTNFLTKPFGSILCVDDDDDAALLEAAVNTISKEIVFTKCYGGREALELLKDKGSIPDVILLDVNMPLLNGFDCLREIRKKSHLKETPVIMLSTSASPKDVTLALDLGALKFFTKPNSYQQIQTMMRQIIDECIVEK